MRPQLGALFGVERSTLAAYRYREGRPDHNPGVIKLQMRLEVDKDVPQIDPIEA
jgi:hypothetical protein